MNELQEDRAETGKSIEWNRVFRGELKYDAAVPGNKRGKREK